MFSIRVALSPGWLAAFVLLLFTRIESGAGVPVVGNFSETTFVADSRLENITALGWAPDGSNRLFIARQDGAVLVVRNGTLLASDFAQVAPTFDSDGCGLLNLCFDPGFATNGYVYFFVTVSASEQQIIRYTATGDTGTNKTVILSGIPTLGDFRNGGGLAVAPDGRLVFGVGDLGNQTGTNADLASLASKLGRVGRDGSTPLDNPFFDAGGPNQDLIWARGFRNPLSIQPQPGGTLLWVNSVGEKWEQVFATTNGVHAGWDLYENSQPSGFRLPAIAYRSGADRIVNLTATGANRTNGTATFTTAADHRFHAGQAVRIRDVMPDSFNGNFFVANILGSRKFTISQGGVDETGGNGSARVRALGGAITGSEFYDSSAAPPAFRNNLLFADFAPGSIIRAVVGTSGSASLVETFIDQVPTAIDVAVGPDGALYYAGYEQGGTPGIFRSEPPEPPTQAIWATPTHLLLDEGTVRAFTVRVAKQPKGNATVTVNTSRTSGDSDLSVAAGGSLIFNAANFDQPQAVVIQAANDADYAADTALFTASSPGLGSVPVQAIALDDDTRQIDLSTTLLNIVEGGNGTAFMNLAVPPAGKSGKVTILRITGDPDIALEKSKVGFSAANFAIPQALRFRAREDSDSLADSATFMISVPGFQSRVITVTAADNDP